MSLLFVLCVYFFTLLCSLSPPSRRCFLAYSSKYVMSKGFSWIMHNKMSLAIVRRVGRAPENWNGESINNFESNWHFFSLPPPQHNPFRPSVLFMAISPKSLISLFVSSRVWDKCAYIIPARKGWGGWERDGQLKFDKLAVIRRKCSPLTREIYQLNVAQSQNLLGH
jgi:hypothetical protein